MRNEAFKVEVNVGQKTFSRDATKPVYETADDVLGSLQDPKSAKDVIDYLNYAIDLKTRAPIRAAILANEAAAEQAIEKQVKDMIKLRAAAGKPVTEKQARKLVEQLMTMSV
jgi:hypothetical protein